MILTRSRNTRDPLPFSSSLPGSLVAIDELFQHVVSSNLSTPNIFRCYLMIYLFTKTGLDKSKRDKYSQ